MSNNGFKNNKKMEVKIIDNWEVELTNDRGDTLTLKGEWYADFFKEYENKQLIIANVVGQIEQYFCSKEQIGQRCHEQCLGCFQFENKD